MKKMKFLFGMLAIGGLLLSSCSNDDDNNTVNDSNGIAGSYEMVEFRTPNETDINKDGTPHPNQMDETECYDDSKLTFNADNTFSYAYRTVNVNAGIATCSSADFNGTWEITGNSGNNINIRATYKDATNENVTVNLVKTGNRLTQTSVLATYPDVNGSNVLVTSIGTVTLVFEK